MGSDNWHYRRRIPAKVRVALAVVPKAQRPPGWFKEHINISLGTADRAQAKAKCPQIAVEVEAAMAAILNGPKPLTVQDISALSGDLCKAFAEGLERGPVATPDQWLRVAAMNEEARQGHYGVVAMPSIHETADEQRRASMEARFGGITDTFLARRGTITDAESRLKLIERASLDLMEGAMKLGRSPDGEYTPDDCKRRRPNIRVKSANGLDRSLTGLAEAWHKAALDRDVRKRDADEIASRFKKLIPFLQHDDAGRVTRQDIVRWKDKRLAEDISVKTINDSDIASFNNVFNWGKERGWLDQNPAKGTAIRTKRRKAKNRDEFFSIQEIGTILRHAAAAVGTKREAPKTTAAKRWVPWLLAYSGARVAEMIQLRKGDVRSDPDHGCIVRLTPEAGSIKTNRFCDVPVHDHLIAEGFLEFVKGSQDGHLFCELGADGTITGPAGGVYKRVRDFVREVIDDKDVAPLHAWRYTFKTYGLEAGIQEITLDAISNHAPKHQGGEYTKVTLRARAEAMARFRRYSLKPVVQPD